MWEVKVELKVSHLTSETWQLVFLWSHKPKRFTRSLAYFWRLPFIDSTKSKTFCLNLRLDSGLSYSDLGLNFLDLRLDSGLVWGCGTSQSRLETCLSWLWIGLRTCLPSFWSWLFWSGTWLSVCVWRCLLRIIICDCFFGLFVVVYMFP